MLSNMLHVLYYAFSKMTCQPIGGDQIGAIVFQIHQSLGIDEILCLFFFFFRYLIHSLQMLGVRCQFWQSVLKTDMYNVPYD